MPFEKETQGETRIPGQPPWRWFLADVQPPNSFRVKMPLDGAVVTFEWRFEELTPARTLLTHTIDIRGGNAAAYADAVAAEFSLTLKPGLEKIARDLEAARRE